MFKYHPRPCHSSNYTIYQQKVYSLNEKCHIYKDDDPIFNNLINAGVDSCINDLLNNQNLEHIHAELDNLDYAKYVYTNILPSYNEVVLYIMCMDDITDSDITDAFILTSREEETAEGLKHVIDFDNNQIGIIIMVNTYLNKLKTPEVKSAITGSIRHELKHLFHYTKSAQLCYNAGWGFTFGYELNEPLDNEKNEQGEVKTNPGIPGAAALRHMAAEVDLDYAITILSAAMYLLDKSEIEAWRESFNLRSHFNIYHTT